MIFEKNTGCPVGKNEVFEIKKEYES